MRLFYFLILSTLLLACSSENNTSLDIQEQNSTNSLAKKPEPKPFIFLRKRDGFSINGKITETINFNQFRKDYWNVKVGETPKGKWIATNTIKSTMLNDTLFIQTETVVNSDSTVMELNSVVDFLNFFSSCGYKVIDQKGKKYSTMVSLERK